VTTSRAGGKAKGRATRVAPPKRSASSGRNALAGIVLRALSREGLLLLQDPRLPSVAGIVAGGPVRGSWWGHGKGSDIFRVSDWLADHPEVVVTRLVSRKVTYVHRKLWPAIVAIGRERQPWQMRRLSRLARSILDRVERAGSLRTDRIPGPPRRVSDAARELEDGLLVHTEWIHTERGSHARRLESWDRWERRMKTAGRAPVARPAGRARAALERVVAGMNSRCAADGRLPWQDEGR